MLQQWLCPTFLPRRDRDRCRCLASATGCGAEPVLLDVVAELLVALLLLLAELLGVVVAELLVVVVAELVSWAESRFGVS